MITLGKKSSKKKKKGGGKYASILTYEQRQKFEDIGLPDPTQNWLEIFTPDLMSDLRTIMRSCSDNQRKCDYVTQELHAYGFEDVGLGTNILTMANPLYPGVVFKIALDDYGVADNFNDCVLQDVVPKYNRVLARDPSAMISVQERQVLMTPAQRELFMPKILRLLHELKEYFLIADLSPDMYLNYGITRDGDFRIIDGSDLYPLHQLAEEPRCNRLVGQNKRTGKYKYCEGKLKYTSDFKWLVCQKCGRQFNPLEFRPRKDVEKLQRILSDGLSAEERDELERKELEAVMQSRSMERSMSPDPKTHYPHEDVPEGAEGQSAGEPKEVTFAEFAGQNHDLGEPRVIVVKPDDDDDGSTKQSPAGSSGVATSGCAGTYSPHGKGNPTKGSLHSDEDGESEAAGEAQDGDDDEDGMPTELHRRTVDEPVQKSEAPDSDACDESMEDVVNRLITSIRRLKFSDADDEREMFRRLMQSVFAEEFAAEAEDGDEEEIQGQNPDAVVETQKLSGEGLISMITALSLSSSPEDQAVYQKLVDKFSASSAGFENDASNSDIHQSGTVEDPSQPHITYKVISDAEAEADESLTPGIYLDIYGDFDEAWEESGLPIWVTLGGDSRMDLVTDVNAVGQLIKHVVDDVLAEQAMIAARNSGDGDDEDEPEDPEEEE